MKKILILGESKSRLLEVQSLLAPIYQVSTIFSAHSFLQTMESMNPHLVIVERPTATWAGFQFVSQIRNSSFSHLPILVFGDKSQGSFLEASVNVGADDTLTYPLEEQEFLARVRSGLRRTGPLQEDDSIQYRGLKVDTINRKFTLDNQEILLSPIETYIMLDLVKNVNALVSRDQLIQTTQLKGYSKNISLNVHICALRRKMGRLGKCIGTVHNQGYMLSDKDFSASSEL